MLHIHWKGNSFCYFIQILKSNFIPYVPILRNIFVPYSTYMHIGKALDYLSHMYASFERCLPLATYSNINIYMVNNIFTSSRHKESMVQPSPTCSHFHDFLHSKTKAWVKKKPWNQHIITAQFAVKKKTFHDGSKETTVVET